jgi:hypothetical protein
VADRSPSNGRDMAELRIYDSMAKPSPSRPTPRTPPPPNPAPRPPSPSCCKTPTATSPPSSKRTAPSRRSAPTTPTGHPMRAAPQRRPGMSPPRWASRAPTPTAPRARSCWVRGSTTPPPNASPAPTSSCLQAQTYRLGRIRSPAIATCSRRRTRLRFMRMVTCRIMAGAPSGGASAPVTDGISHVLSGLVRSVGRWSLWSGSFWGNRPAEHRNCFRR